MGEMTLREALERAADNLEAGARLHDCPGLADAASLARQAIAAEPTRKYALGDRLTKTKGSAWTGRVVGFYSTEYTPVGYCVESENEPGSVQIYPEVSLKRCEDSE